MTITYYSAATVAKLGLCMFSAFAIVLAIAVNLAFKAGERQGNVETIKAVYDFKSSL
jgi:hypothetical protein